MAVSTDTLTTITFFISFKWDVINFFLFNLKRTVSKRIFTIFLILKMQSLKRVEVSKTRLPAERGERTPQVAMTWGCQHCLVDLVSLGSMT